MKTNETIFKDLARAIEHGITDLRFSDKDGVMHTEATFQLPEELRCSEAGFKAAIPKIRRHCRSKGMPAGAKLISYQEVDRRTHGRKNVVAVSFRWKS